jgi:hypothetical protein
MNKMMNYFAGLTALIILSFLWLSYLERGCWVLGGRTQGGLIILCGSSGLAIGLAFSAIVLFAVYRWYKKSNS